MPISFSLHYHLLHIATTGRPIKSELLEEEVMREVAGSFSGVEVRML